MDRFTDIDKPFFFLLSIRFCFTDSAFSIIGLNFTITRNSSRATIVLMILKVFFFFFYGISLLLFRKIEKEFVSTSVY